MIEFTRSHHRTIAGILALFDGAFLERAECFFGGGTQIALAYGEFRESRDIDFLCASRAGFRMLRETVNERSLGAVFRQPVHLARDVRADRDGVRTFVEFDQVKIKLEFVLEGRIDLAGIHDPRLGLRVLDVPSRIAEKLLANADRGLDRTTRSRDLVDLAFCAAHHPLAELKPGLALAEAAYGTAVRRQLAAVLDQFVTDRRYLGDCLRSLGIKDAATLRRGLTRLRRLATPNASARPGPAKARSKTRPRG